MYEEIKKIKKNTRVELNNHLWLVQLKYCRTEDTAEITPFAIVAWARNFPQAWLKTDTG